MGFYFACLLVLANILTVNAASSIRVASGQRLSYLSSEQNGRVHLKQHLDDHSGRQKWIFKHLFGDVYNIIVSGGTDPGEKFLSCRADGFVDLWTHDEGDRQKWRIQEIGSNTYNIKVFGGTNLGEEFLSCREDGFVDLYSHEGIRQRWKLDIGSVFLIAGGYSAERDIELYHPTIENLNCITTPPPLNDDWVFHISFYHDQTIHLCGGEKTKSSCISYNRKMSDWKTHSLSPYRIRRHSSVVLRNILYLIGGVDSNDDFIDSVSTPLPLTDTPVLTTIHSLSNAYKGWGHCSMELDEDNLLIIGGYYQGSPLSAVTQYSISTHTSKALPSLRQERYGHACIMVQRDNKKWVIVTAGYFGGKLYTTEMLELGQSTWIYAGSLNVKRTGVSMVDTERGIMVIGGWSRISSVELMDWSTKRWSLVQPSIKIGRHHYTATEIPLSMFNCVVDVIDGNWGTWSSCSKMCLGGKRTRSCTMPAPKNGGKQCEGESTESTEGESTEYSHSGCDGDYLYRQAYIGGIETSISPGETCHSVCQSRDECITWTWTISTMGTKECRIQTSEAQLEESQGAMSGTKNACKPDCYLVLEDHQEAEKYLETDLTKQYCQQQHRCYDIIHQRPGEFEATDRILVCHEEEEGSFCEDVNYENVNLICNPDWIEANLNTVKSINKHTYYGHLKPYFGNWGK